MIPNCCADVTDIFSPLAYQEEGGSLVAAPARGIADPRMRLPVFVDDGFFFRCTLYKLHCAATRCVRALPVHWRLGVEVLLLFAVLVQLAALVALHSLLLPSPGVQQLGVASAGGAGGGLAGMLTAAVRAAPGSGVEFLRVSLETPTLQLQSRPGGSAGAAAPGVRCEFAAERALLELPLAVRESAFQAAGGQALSISVNASGFPVVVPLALLQLPALASAVLSRQILSAIVQGPLCSAAGGYGEATADSSTTSTVDKWSILAWTPLSSADADARRANQAFAYVSCDGAPPLSMQPLHRVAELLHRRTEWWLFKAVWALSTTILVLFAAVAVSFAVRSALLGLFRVRAAVQRGCWASVGDRLEVLEAAVLVASPAALLLALCRLVGDAAGSLVAVLLCLAGGEVAALCMLRTQESRYLFPRAMLPAYVADVYYAFFHPFGFTWLSHCALWCFQGFLLCTLWGHFEAAAELPDTCPDHLSVEVRMRPKEEQRGGPPQAPPALSAPVQRLLLEQSLLLLGDDRSYESGVVMSAIVARALQVTKVVQGPPGPPTPSIERLGGGPVVQTLVNHASSGDERCSALMQHLLTRLPQLPQLPQLQQWQAQQQQDQPQQQPLRGQVRPPANAACAAVHGGLPTVVEEDAGETLRQRTPHRQAAEPPILMRPAAADYEEQLEQRPMRIRLQRPLRGQAVERSPRLHEEPEDVAGRAVASSLPSPWAHPEGPPLPTGGQ